MSRDVFGLIIGIGVRLATTRAFVGGIALATLVHALFNRYGVSLVVANWLIDR